MMITGEVTYYRLFEAMKAVYEVDNDDSVWEIFSQADDPFDEIVSALKLISEPEKQAL